MRWLDCGYRASTQKPGIILHLCTNTKFLAVWKAHIIVKHHKHPRMFTCLVNRLVVRARKKYRHTLLFAFWGFASVHRLEGNFLRVVLRLSMRGRENFMDFHLQLEALPQKHRRTSARIKMLSASCLSCSTTGADHAGEKRGNLGVGCVNCVCWCSLIHTLSLSLLSLHAFFSGVF